MDGLVCVLILCFHRDSRWILVILYKPPGKGSPPFWGSKYVLQKQRLPLFGLFSPRRVGWCEQLLGGFQAWPPNNMFPWRGVCLHGADGDCE